MNDNLDNLSSAIDNIIDAIPWAREAIEQERRSDRMSRQTPHNAPTGASRHTVAVSVSRGLWVDPLGRTWAPGDLFWAPRRVPNHLAPVPYSTTSPFPWSLLSTPLPTRDHGSGSLAHFATCTHCGCSMPDIGCKCQ